MSALDDLVTALAAVADDAGELSAALHRQSVQLARAASHTAVALAGSRHVGGKDAVAALQAAARATELASLQLERAAHRGREFAARHGGVGAGGPVISSPVEASADGGRDAGEYLRARGLVEFDPRDADYSDNPLIGSFTRSAEMSRDDYVWAVRSWDDVVRPGLEQGMDRDDFAEMDAATQAPPLRRLADVHDIFLGSDPIVLSRRADGTLEVTGGRHRIEVARELLIHRLPAVIH